MNGKEEDELLKRLLPTFKAEAWDHLKTISLGIVEMEDNPSEEERQKLVESVYREAHSLKGAARSVKFVEVEDICQSLESVFAAMKRRGIAFSTPLT
jgi:two-component system chemotaxis sensor kinase CheA